MFNVLCNVFMSHDIYIYIPARFHSKHGGKSHWNANARQYIVTMQGATAYWTHLLLQTNPVLCPSRKMHFDGSIMGLISVHVK